MTRVLGQVLSFLLYTLIVIIAAVAIILQVAAIWIASDAGQAWLRAELEKTMEESDYSLSIDDVDIAFIGVNLDGVTLTGSDGLKVMAEDVTLRFNPFPLTYKQLGIYVSSRTLKISELPEEGDKPTKKLQQLALPDMYFDKIGVHIDIHTLLLPDNDVELGLKINQIFAQDESLVIRNEGKISIDSQGHDWMPNEISNDIVITEGEINIAALIISANNYIIDNKGKYSIGGDKIILQTNGRLNTPQDDKTKPGNHILLQADLQGDTEALSGSIGMNANLEGTPLNVKTQITLSPDQAELKDIIALADDAQLKGHANISFEEKQANATLTDLVWRELAVNEVTVKAQYPDTEKVALPTGQISVSGLKYDQHAIQNAMITLKNPHPNSFLISLKGDGKTQSPFQFNGTGVMNTAPSPILSIPEFSVTTEGARLTLSGEMSKTHIDARMTATAENLAMLPMVPSIPLANIALDDLSVTVSQSPTNPRIDGVFKLSANKNQDNFAAVSGSLGYVDNVAQIVFSGDGQAFETLDGRVIAPLQISFYPFAFSVQQDKNLDGKIAALLDLDSLSVILPFSGIEYGGQLQTDAKIVGTLSTIGLDGHMKVSDGMVMDRSGGIVLEDIEAQAIFDRQAITINNFKAVGENGIGGLEATGRIGLADLSSPQLQAELKANNVKLLQGPPYDLRLNGDLLLSSPDNGYLVSGELSLGALTIQLPEVAGGSIPKLNIVEIEEEHSPSVFDKMRLDLTFKAADRIFIRGYGVDAELGGELAIDGTITQPKVTGVLSAVRGRFEQFGRRFNLNRSDIRFTGEHPPAPRLDILAVADINDIETRVMLKGTPEDPNIEFASNPSLPDDEILAMILFGEDISQISPLQALQLASTLSRLSGLGGGGGFNLIGGIRDATGLDDIRIDGAGENARLGIGKYISDDVYVDVSGGAGEESGAASIEVELTPSVTLESRVGQTGETESNIFWQWDY